MFDVQQRVALLVVVGSLVVGITGADGDCRQQCILAAKKNYQACMSTSCVQKPRDCSELKVSGYNSSGVYTVYYMEGNVWVPVRVYCDMETAGGGWIVFQRRQDGSGDFYRNWMDYTNGFGSLTGEFWVGNYHLHMLTSSGKHKLRVDLGDFEGETRHADYSTFSVGDPSSTYTLSASGYSGDAGDALGTHNGMKFTTKDQDNDVYAGNCSSLYKGGWWYQACHHSNLNGLYLGGKHTSYADGIEWYQWKGHHYSLKFTEMKFKPV